MGAAVTSRGFAQLRARGAPDPPRGRERSNRKRSEPRRPLLRRQPIMQLRGAFLALCSGILLGLSPAPSEPGPDVAPWLRSPTGWEAHLAPPEEPGGRFVMEGRVLGPGDLLP